MLGAVTDAWRLQPSWTQRQPDVACPCEAEESGEIARCRLAARGESRFLLVYTGAVAFSLQLPELVIQCGHGHG